MSYFRISVPLSFGCMMILGCGTKSNPDIQQNVEAPQTVSDDSFFARLKPILGSSTKVDSEPELRSWLTTRWDRLEAKGPSAFRPSRTSFAEDPWPGKKLNLYVALYPREIASNVLDFDVFVWYTSSIQQDMIRDGKTDLGSFFPETKEVGVNRFVDFVYSCELLSDHGTIVSKIRSFELPREFQWVSELKFNSAIVADGDDEIELVADTTVGFLTLFSLDG